jgi:hypothetical protein
MKLCALSGKLGEDGMRFVEELENMKLRHAIALLFLTLVFREMAYSQIELKRLCDGDSCWWDPSSWGGPPEKKPEPCVQKLVGYIHRCEVKPLGQGMCYVQFPDGLYGWVKQPTEFGKTAEYCP